MASLASFAVGAAFSGWAARALEHRYDRWMLVMSALEALLLGLAALSGAVPGPATHTESTVGILALAMGTRYRGLELVDFAGYLVAAAYNLVRLAKLAPLGTIP